MTALGALVFTGISLNATRQQTALNEQGQITDRYGKAVEQIGRSGPDNLQIRLGGIYALERLARDSPRDQPTIIEVLSALIRTSTPFDNSCSHNQPVNADIQAALTVLARRDTNQDQGTRIDLRNACLYRAELEDGNLDNAYLSGVDLTSADLHRAHLANTIFHGAKLNNAYAGSADLHNASFLEAHLDHVHLIGANLQDAYLMNAFATEASIGDANLTNADLSWTNLTDAYLVGVVLNGATLMGTDFRGADLTNAKHDNFTGVAAITDARTKGEWW